MCRRSLLPHLLEEIFYWLLVFVAEKIDKRIPSARVLSARNIGFGNLAGKHLKAVEIVARRSRFQSICFNLKLGRFIPTGPQCVDHTMNVFPLFGRRLLELDAHTKFRVHYQDHSASV